MKINLGCGQTLLPDCVNVDAAQLPGVDVVHDLGVTPWPWPDNSATHVSAFHLFEHLADPVSFMTEAHRVLVPGGKLIIVVPYYRDPGAFTDPTHKRFCTENTFDYWTRGTPLHEGLGLAMGSPPAVFAREFLDVYEGREIRLILVKEV